MCMPVARPGGPWTCHCGCWGGEGGRYPYRFPSLQEERQRLEDYRRQLQEELAAVERRVRDLKVE